MQRVSQLNCINIYQLVLRVSVHSLWREKKKHTTQGLVFLFLEQSHSHQPGFFSFNPAEVLEGLQDSDCHLENTKHGQILCTITFTWIIHSVRCVMGSWI